MKDVTKRAGTLLTGAAIGTAIAPGVGTVVGLIAGGILGNIIAPQDTSQLMDDLKKGKIPPPDFFRDK